MNKTDKGKLYCLTGATVRGPVSHWLEDPLQFSWSNQQPCGPLSLSQAPLETAALCPWGEIEVSDSYWIVVSILREKITCRNPLVMRMQHAGPERCCQRIIDRHPPHFMRQLRLPFREFICQCLWIVTDDHAWTWTELSGQYPAHCVD